MKIGMADSCGGKFCTDIREHWEKQGHEVRFERGASEFIAQWADVYYFDWADNNIHYIYKLYHDQLPEYPHGSSFHRPRLIVRAIDWDVWIGYARNQDLVDFVDQWVCIAPHIERKLRAEASYREGQLKLIRPGVNLEKFTLKTKQTDGFQMGMVLGDLYWYKNHMAGLDIFTSLYQKDPRWRLHIRGQHEPGEYHPVMYQHYLESRGIADAVTLYSSVPDMNDWYENIDVLLAPGMKEAYCYAAAEALSKGIPAIINNFYGSRDIWGYKTYNTHEEAIEAISVINEMLNNSSNYLPQVRAELRDFIKVNYDAKRMFYELDQLLTTV